MLRRFDYWIVVLTLLATLLGCSGNQSATLPKGKKVLPSKHDKIIKDSFGHYRIYQRPDKSYYVYQNGRILYDRLRFITHATLPGKNNMQALDQNNKRIEFSLYQLDMPSPLLCGTGTTEYRIDISENPNAFVLGVTLTGGDVDNFSASFKKMLNKVQPIATVSKSAVDDLYFSKGKKRITFEGSIDDQQSMLYYRVGKKYGFYGKLRPKGRLKYRISRESQKLYDEMDFVGDDIYVRRGVLWGCAGKTAVKYRKLSPFLGRLARFELPNGRRGYVTDKGVEYVD